MVFACGRIMAFQQVTKMHIIIIDRAPELQLKTR